MKNRATDFGEPLDNLIIAKLNGHRGHENRIKRDQLLVALNVNWPVPVHDRYMRTRIEWLRRHSEPGAWICSALDGGYFLAETLDELKHYLDSEESRLVNLAKKIGRQRKVAGLPLSGQLHIINDPQP